jgi:hypothetical protein
VRGGTQICCWQSRQDAIHGSAAAGHARGGVQRLPIWACRGTQCALPGGILVLSVLAEAYSKSEGISRVVHDPLCKQRAQRSIKVTLKLSCAKVPEHCRKPPSPGRSAPPVPAGHGKLWKNNAHSAHQLNKRMPIASQVLTMHQRAPPGGLQGGKRLFETGPALAPWRGWSNTDLGGFTR